MEQPIIVFMPRKRKVTRFGPRKMPTETSLERAWNEGKYEKRMLFKSRKTKRELVHGRGRGFITKPTNNLVTKIQEIVLTLQRNGILVPRITRIDMRNNIVVFEKKGRALDSVVLYALKKLPVDTNKIPLQTRRFLSSVFAKYARALATMQSLGIMHGHPHANNVIYYKNRVGFIDFSFGTLPQKMSWNHWLGIVNAFELEWGYIARDFKAFKLRFPKFSPFFDSEARKFFQRLLRKYPCDETTRKKLWKIIEQQYLWP